MTNGDRDIVVVSAPGKRYKDDIKITDSLISIYEDKERLVKLKERLEFIKMAIKNLDSSMK